MAPRGIRNNNFGNIEDGAFAQGLPGYTGTDGRFATFSSPQYGLNAQSELLRRYGGQGINSVQGIINRWAPASDGNNTGAYGNYVAKQLGIGPNDQLDLNDTAQRVKTARAMAEYENGPNAMNAALSGDGGDIPDNAQATSGTAPPDMGPYAIGGQPTVIAGPAAGTKDNGPDWSQRIGGAAASLMAISDPKGAAVLAAMNRPKEKDQWTPVTLPDGRVMRMNHRTGEMQQVTSAPKPVKESPPLNETGLKTLIETETKANGADWLNQQAQSQIEAIKSGKLNLGLFNNWLSKGKNAAGISDDQSRAFAKFEQFKQLLSNEQLLRAKGVQTEGDAVRAMTQYFGGNASYDNQAATDALQQGIANGRNELQNYGNAFKAHGELYPSSPSVQQYITRHNERMKRYSAPAASSNRPSLDSIFK